ncbi:thioredoxin family protein [Kineosporia sp. A_224]|uniref:thioredoxin family protein n=1 Tax=Kineosporia sp. A_224 TaxID=1962180 RepID=UPI000B4C0A2C|nr:thioredoxin family protein [Kineosporia sp. A_224]
MIVKVLGPGCANCVTLEKRTRQALADLGLDVSVEKVTDYAQIAAYGVMTTPGLVVDEQVVLQGRVPTVAALGELLGAAARA